ncbi:unnamed protein product [Ambrosiozyma monospora]|uniref:Unnamed protein product n=1 Tax=Ambrosiozyma monospora TaxID=43982 RepID=A0A9W6Z8I2_AMBMO|nr:unnamed protein product [Ambrosiozyma monospora]
MKQLCIMLSSLGCDLTLSYTQQDSLQLYEFLAECLSLPLITIKLDIIHSGKLNVKDDLRLIEERALLISVPTDINYNTIAEDGSSSESRSNSKADGKPAEPDQSNVDKKEALKGTTTEGATKRSDTSNNDVSMNGGEGRKATNTNSKGPASEGPTVSSSDLEGPVTDEIHEFKDAKTGLEVLYHKDSQNDNIEQGNTTSAIDGRKEIANGNPRAESAESEPTKTSTSTETKTVSATKKYSSLLPPPLPPKDYDSKSRNASAGSNNSGNQNGHTHDQSHHSHNSHHSHHSHHQLEEPISLEECLNSYFNNSVTVRRHLDKKRMYDTIPSNDSRPNACDKKNGSPTSSNGTAHEVDMEEYARRGIVTSESNGPTVVSQCPEGALYEAIDGVKGAVVHEEVTSITDLTETLSNSTIGESVSGIDQCTSTIERTGTVGSASYSKVSDKLEASRTRSSTIVSVLNNAAAATSSSGSASAQRTLTRRKSSVSNTEVSLPAWMFLQLLPYYNDPKAKLQFENHEEYYRRRASRAKTLDSVEFDVNANNDSSGTTLRLG